MSAYIYAIIPYHGAAEFNPEGSDTFLCPIIPELNCVDSELTEQEFLELYDGFLVINTCYRVSTFANNSESFNWLRAEIYKIAKAVGAKEVWYAEELALNIMDMPGFTFEAWKNSLKNENKQYVAELTVEVLKGQYTYSYYHDDFEDIVLKQNDNHINPT